MPEDRVHQMRWDGWLRRRPKCLDCGQPILEDRCLPLPDGMVCERCVERRMIWIEVD